MERNTGLINPGLCPAEGCPAPTRIECILVDKVYDSCFQQENLPSEKVCVMVDTGAFSPGQVIPCSIDNAVINCTEVERTPVGNGFSEVVLAFNVANIIIQNPNNPAETLPLEVTPFIKTFTLCGPEGTEIDCSGSNITRCTCLVGSVVPIDGGVGGFQIFIVCQIQVCLVVRSIRRVQLLLPSYGYCVPSPCSTLPGICPPAPPAQCF